MGRYVVVFITASVVAMGGGAFFKVLPSMADHPDFKLPGGITYSLNRTLGKARENRNRKANIETHTDFTRVRLLLRTLPRARTEQR